MKPLTLLALITVTAFAAKLTPPQKTSATPHNVSDTSRMKRQSEPASTTKSNPKNRPSLATGVRQHVGAALALHTVNVLRLELLRASGVLRRPGFDLGRIRGQKLQGLVV